MQVLRDVLDNYLTTRAEFLGRALVNETKKDQRCILRDIPQLLTQRLVDLGVAQNYKVEGSIGIGNMARVPWVAVFDRAVTETAQEGYYIVLLFAEDMSSCFLSLNQGVTQLEKLFTANLARRKMKEAAKLTRQFFEPHAEAELSEIDLHATGDLGKGYQAAAIESFRYLRDALPTELDFLTHFDILLKHYAQLSRIFKRELHSLVTIDESEFQQAVLEKAAKSEDIYQEPPGPMEIRTLLGFAGRGQLRSPRVAAQAIKNAGFRCELNQQHQTFRSRAKQQQYVEAHHLIPISRQSQFVYSLDVVANIVALCATCHRLLHHGVQQDKKARLKKLFATRKAALIEKSIGVDERDFLRFYGGDLAPDD